MCKEMPVIPVNNVVDPNRIIRRKWRAKEEERHKGLLSPQKLHFGRFFDKIGRFFHCASGHTA
jgi:hypothetical protein